MGKNKRDIRVRTNIAISFISIFLLFSLPEVIFRITDKKWSTENMYKRFLRGGQTAMKIPLNIRDPYLFWRTPKEFEFRGMKHNLTKDASTVRIICLGDSCTQGFIKEGGMNMRADKAYPGRLQKLLNTYNKKSQKRYEVINAGVGAYSSLQGLRYFKRDLLKYNPDIITFYFGINDNNSRVVYSDNEQKIFPRSIVSLHNVFMKSRFYQLLVYLQKKRILKQ